MSREGVQRDLLPLVEGCTVSTKYGQIKTDHVLFIASGAFHMAKPSDLIPELQGRFPIRVELEALTQEDFVRILTELTSRVGARSQDLALAIHVLGDLDADTWRRIFDVNVIAPFSVLRELGDQLAPDATVVNITSDAGVEAYEGWGGYGGPPPGGGYGPPPA